MSYCFTFLTWFGFFALSGFVGACDEGGGGMGGSSGMGDDPNLADRQSLSMCAEESWCRIALAQRIEGGDTFTINDAECLLAALRDRVEGTYEIELDHTFSNGSATDVHLLVITPSGNVERSVAFTEIIYDADTIMIYRPTERCTPKSPSFFDECLKEVEVTCDPEEDGCFPQDHMDAAWECVFPGLDGYVPGDLPWFEDCVEQPPSCE